MATKLSGNMSKLIHRMGQEREDRIISGKTNLTVAAIFLMDDNWKVFNNRSGYWNTSRTSGIDVGL